MMNCNSIIVGLFAKQRQTKTDIENKCDSSNNRISDTEMSWQAYLDQLRSNNLINSNSK